jgi:hypothetical protein
LIGLSFFWEVIHGCGFSNDKLFFLIRYLLSFKFFWKHLWALWTYLTPNQLRVIISLKQIILPLHLLINHHLIGSGTPNNSSAEIIPTGNNRVGVPCHLGCFVNLFEMIALLLLFFQVCELSHELPSLIVGLEIGAHALSFLNSLYDVLVLLYQLVALSHMLTEKLPLLFIFKVYFVFELLCL